MNYTFRQAILSDMRELLSLYTEVYGNTYPIAFGTDLKVMAGTIKNPEVHWIVAVSEDNRVVGSVVFEKDTLYRVAKVEGLVVSPEHQNQKLGSRLLDHGMNGILNAESSINSVFATTRTQSIVVQRLFLRHHFLPLGVFPNSHRLRQYETLTLFARFKEGVLERRAVVNAVPCELQGILEVSQQTNGLKIPTTFIETPKPVTQPRCSENFEIIDAPEFVFRRFNEKVKDRRARFFPFCRPNLLLSSTDGKTEVFAFFNKLDRYCAIISSNLPLSEMRSEIEILLEQLRDKEVSYIEFLLPLSDTLSLQTVLEAGFVPSAFYPALYECQGEMHDYVILSYSLEPLDFRHMEVDRSFKHYMDHYVRQWTKKHILGVEVLDAR